LKNYGKLLAKTQGQFIKERHTVATPR
jgi:hypothetical protein